MSVCLGCCVCCFSSCEQWHARVCLFGVCLFGRLLNNCWRPYHVECTGSLLTSEVKRHRARLVLGWGTAWEDLRVLPASSIQQGQRSRAGEERGGEGGGGGRRGEEEEERGRRRRRRRRRRQRQRQRQRLVLCLSASASAFIGCESFDHFVLKMVVS